MSTARAPGKIILLGEHAVVYGQPALAVPLTQLFAEARVEAGPRGEGITIAAPDLGQAIRAEQEPDHPLVRAVLSGLELAGHRTTEPDLAISVRSTLPIASGLGSGAAIVTALIRAVLMYFGIAPSAADVSDRAFEIEKAFHGTPSGIDNTVISYEMPVYFIRGQAPSPFKAGKTIHLLVADTGIASPTKITVGRVREGFEQEPGRFQPLFEAIGAAVDSARRCIEAGELRELGRLMNRNHSLLQQMGVSSPELDRLVDTAQGHGALGAKLSGAGGGGNMIALLEPEQRDTVKTALIAAGAVRVIHTDIE